MSPDTSLFGYARLDQVQVDKLCLIESQRTPSLQWHVCWQPRQISDTTDTLTLDRSRAPRRQPPVAPVPPMSIAFIGTEQPLPAVSVAILSDQALEKVLWVRCRWC